MPPKKNVNVFCIIIHVAYITVVVTRNNDYWIENYNDEKNCADLQILSAMEGTQCETVEITSGVERAFSKCIIHLEHILDKGVFK